MRFLLCMSDEMSKGVQDNRPSRGTKKERRSLRVVLLLSISLCFLLLPNDDADRFWLSLKTEIVGASLSMDQVNGTQEFAYDLEAIELNLVRSMFA